MVEGACHNKALVRYRCVVSGQLKGREFSKIVLLEVLREFKNHSNSRIIALVPNSRFRLVAKPQPRTISHPGYTCYFESYP